MITPAVIRRRKKKREVSPRERALATYVWFLFSILTLMGVYGVAYPSMIRHLATAGRSGGPAADLLLNIGGNLHRHWFVALAPALVSTVLWLSPMDRQAVHRVLYWSSAAIGLALIAGSAALFLDYFG